MKNWIVLLVSVVVIGCSSNPAPGTPAAAAAQEEEKQERQKTIQETAVEEAPEWYLRPPVSDTALYGIGEALQDSLKAARRASVLSAQADLANRVQGYVKGKTEAMFDSETFEALGIDQFVTDVIKSVTGPTQLSGLTVLDSKFVAVEGKIQGYAIVEYPVGLANRALVNELKRDQRLAQEARRSKAFAELEEEISRLQDQ